MNEELRMREIKFRAWNRETKRMWWFDVMWGNTWNPGSGWVGMVDAPDGKRIYGKSINSGDNRIQVDINDCELMQYTGLKDKNGVEIYEGDIIQWWNKITKPEVVEATDGGWNPFIDSCTTDHPYHYEVIGNIYENPGLVRNEG